MSVQTVRRIAADILKAGESRIRVLDVKRATEALTREDIRNLIKDKAVILLPKQGISRGEARIAQTRKRSGRGRGEGKKKGSMYAGTSKKDLWMRKVRSLRKSLKNNKFRLESKDYRKIYRMVSGNSVKNKIQLSETIGKFQKGKTV
ncbi:50S ribosomal protein L19e [Candidatus Micrarchaeota archaeon]|nr:50S ribosomal protein L19e [Candidatus Micrarchaeota archaeon]